MAIIAGVLYFIGKGLTNPLQSLARTVQLLGTGDLSVKAEVKSKDEISILAKTFNEMTENLQKTIVSRDYVESIMKSMADTLIVVNPDATIKTVNQAVLNLLDYAENQLIGNPIGKIFAEEEEEEEEVFKGTRLQKLIEKGTIKDYNVFFRTKSGNKIPMSLSGSVMRDESNRLISIVCVAKDMREINRMYEEREQLAAAAVKAERAKKVEFEEKNRKLADGRTALIYMLNDLDKTGKELKESEEKFRTMNEASPLGIFVSDQNGDCTYTNLRWQEITGFTFEGSLGQGWRRAIHPEDVERVDQDFYEAAQKEEMYEGEMRYLRNDGRTVWVHVKAAPMKKDDQAVGYLGVVDDITEQKEKDKMLLVHTRQAQMGEMLSMIAHQWRQPLSDISMEAGKTRQKLSWDTVKDADKDDMVIESFQKIEDTTQYLSKIIGDFRNFYRPDKEKESISVKEIFQKTLDIFRPSLKASNIDLREHYKSNEKIETYVNELVQAFLIILTNAKEALGEKGIENPFIRINEFEKNRSIVIEVSDNGGGIPKENIGKIFDPYFSTKGQVGTGLGLYMCKTIIQNCRGEIGAFNAEEGAKFVIKLPLTDELKT